MHRRIRRVKISSKFSFVLSFRMQANMDARRDGDGGPRFKSRGAMIMKTVSILLVSSRRVSNQRKEKKAGAAAAGKKRKNKMDESVGKVTPKLLESLKKRTHFSKYYLNCHPLHLTAYSPSPANTSISGKN